MLGSAVESVNDQATRTYRMEPYIIQNIHLIVHIYVAKRLLVLSGLLRAVGALIPSPQQTDGKTVQ